MSLVSDPIIRTENPDKIKQYTEISFIPDYCGLFNYPEYNDDVYDSIEPVISMKTYQSAAFAGWISGGKCKIYYNGKKIPINSTADMAKFMFPDMQTFSQILGKDTKYPWDIVVGLKSNSAKKKSDILQFSNVNGIHVSGGVHVDFILEQIIKGVKAQITKILKTTNIKFQSSYVYNNISIFINCQIPGVDWDEQRKDYLRIPAAKISKYILPDSFIKQITGYLRDQIIDTIYEKTPDIGLEMKDKKKKLKIPQSKYSPAHLAGTSRSQECSLFLPEGDSGKVMCSSGLGTLNPKIREKFGIFTLRGVMINVRKATSVNKYTGKREWNEKMNENEFFKLFLQVTGLNVRYKYDKGSPTYKKEMKELKYGSIIIFTDADSDGAGKIAMLLIVIIHLFWPNLLSSGYVKIFKTPIIRAYPKTRGRVSEFYYEYEYEEWLQKNNPDNFRIRYYKGLGSHNKEEIYQIFRRLNENIFTITVDDETDQILIDMYDKDSNPRKRILSQPVPKMTKEIALKQFRTKCISATEQARYDGIAHKSKNMEQKLVHIIDGMNEVGRKILCGGIQYFRGVNHTVKIDVLSGSIMSSMCYHHGPGPLQNAIIRSAFIYPGGVQLPHFLPEGCFGNREKGSDGHSAARYIETIINKKLVDVMYPPEDESEYEYRYDEGKKIEPEYYVPIIPPVHMNYQLPSDGWRGKYWARDAFDIIRVVRLMILTHDPTKIPDEIPAMRMYTTGFNGKLRYIRGKLFSFGVYEYDEVERTIRITELPFCVWWSDYLDMLEKKKTELNISGKTVRIIKDIKNLSGADYVDIILYLEDPNNGYDPIELIDEYADGNWTDGVEEFFMLRDTLDDHLNYMYNNGVICCKTYEDVVKFWFPIRKKYYELRIDRLLKIFDIEILYYENITRYVSEYTKLGINHIKEEEATRILEENKFVKFNKSNISAINKFPLRELDEKIFGVNATYDYLLLTTDRDKLTAACSNRRKKLEKLKEDRKKLIESASRGKFRGAYIWLEELEKLEKIITFGQKTDWKYENHGKYTF